jgi:hypothetical protein
MNRLQFYILICISFLLVNCGSPEGNIGWMTTYDEGMSELDREFGIQTDFQMTRTDLFFSPQETIHFVYVFNSRVSSSDEFYFSLNKKSIDYLEVDLRRKTIEEGNPVIRDYYRGLGIGDYLLKIAYEGEVFDQVEFKVLPEEGYYAETIEGDLTVEIEDEIVRYSR